jgi:hypothetical protein
MNTLDHYLKLALRAHFECRATWEALMKMKNPLMVGYVKQASIAHGLQPVNNATAPAYAVSPAPENEKPQNELLEAKDGERLYFEKTGTASGADPAMAALGAINGPRTPEGQAKASRNAFKGGHGATARAGSGDKGAI